MMNVKENDSKYIANTYARFPVVITGGKGSLLYDENGKEYIDLATGIAVNTFGAADSEWVNAVTEQLNKIQHTSNLYYTAPQTELARILCERTGLKKVFFSNSGAEANECAIKAARKYAAEKKGGEYYEIVTLKNSFHGRTMATLSATGQDVFHNYFFPFLPGFVNVKANDIADLKAKLDEYEGKVCAVMFEFIQGEGGVIPLEKAFVDAIFEECGKRDILTIADEVQTGAGRTGKFLTSQNYGVQPDITTLAKGAAGGVPIGICMAGKKCCDTLTPGTHGSTFGGNPLACAGGNAVLDTVLAEGFLDEVNKKGEYFRKKLAVIPEVEGVDGMGLMLGIRLKSKNASEVCKACLENGLLILTAKTKLRFLPPLNISYAEIDKGIEILTKILG